MNPIFVAIDTPDIDRAVQLAEAVREDAGGVKLGLEFFAAQGPAGVERIASLGLPIFLDLKLHDIPNTVGKAVEAIAPLKPAVLTVHAAGGRLMLAAARTAAHADTKVVAVTVLTSLDHTDLAQAGVAGSPEDQVQRLAKLAQDAGVDGIVCSGAEVARARDAWPERMSPTRSVSSLRGRPWTTARRSSSSGAPSLRLLTPRRRSATSPRA